MAKTFLALLTAELLLGGCASAQERAQQAHQERERQATICQERGLKEGTVEYAQCLNPAHEPPWWGAPVSILLRIGTL